MSKYGVSTVYMCIFMCAPEGILLLLVCMDLLFFVLFVVSACPVSRGRSNCKVPQACVLAGVALQNMKG